MTAVVVASVPLRSSTDFAMPDNSTEARKRRREILSTQRGVSPDAVTSHHTSDVSTSDNPRKRKMSEDTDTSNNKVKSKKPQMKYEPEVPMTKEEAAIWRREQRRKRNRESAAASRQRQRDRITELEGEVEEMKVKYSDTLDKIREMENNLGLPPTAEFIPVVRTSSPRPETPEPSHKAITITPRSSPTVQEVTSDEESVEVKVKKEDEEMEPSPTKMTSRQA